MLASLALLAIGPTVLVPTPKSLSFTGGVFSLRDSTRISAPLKLRKHAEALRDDVYKLTGLRLKVTDEAADFDDISLAIAGRADGYRLVVDSRIRLTGGSPTSVASGMTTLLQGLEGRSLPQMTVEDYPDYAYRGAMLDLARKHHTIEGIRQIVDLCRLYKLNYLHLHLSDDHLFMFPSKAFPNLGKGNHEFARFDPPSTDAPIKPYSWTELRELDEYAAARGVYLVPEIDMPGHGSRLTQDAPEHFRATEKNSGTINYASAKTKEACRVLLGEVMEVFRHSPYVHLGGDEVWTGELAEVPEFKGQDPHDLYRKFVVEMCEFIRSKGRKAIVWEEAYHASLPKHATVMAWNISGPIAKMMSEGYSVINAGWTPLYIVREDRRPVSFLERWRVTQFGGHPTSFTDWIVADGPGLLGAQMCSWENAESTELQSLRRRLPVVAERTWNRDSSGSVRVRDSLLDLLTTEVSITPLTALLKDENTFDQPLRVEMRSASKGVIRYRLDNRIPTAESPVYSGPITLMETAWIRAAAFDRAGRRIGPVAGAWFRYVPKSG